MSDTAFSNENPLETPTLAYSPGSSTEYGEPKGRRSTEYLAPRDTVELELTKIWSEVLEIWPIGVRDNFFDDLGGHSMNAVRMFRQIEQRFGTALPLATLFGAATIEQLARILCQSGESAPWSSLVAIQTGGDKPPFFGVHGGGGGVFIYSNLARYLNPEQPVYGLQAQALDGKQVPHTRVEDMAAHYIREILTVQPQGPYFLGGYSFGGLVAFEMAQQLHAQGQEVALLALFDARSPQYLKPLPFPIRVYRHLARLLRLETKEKLTYLQGKVQRLHNLACKFYSGNRRDSFQTRYQYNLHDVHQQAEIDYVPTQVYSGRAILFRASEQLPLEWWFDPHDPHLGWDRLITGGLETQDIPGNHLNIFNEASVRVLAEKLQACLDQALIASRSSRNSRAKSSA